MQNMWLAASSLGLGGCWVTLDEQITKRIVSLPDDHELIGGLVLGHIEEKATKKNEKKDRKALSMMVSYEVYGSNKA